MFFSGMILPLRGDYNSAKQNLIQKGNCFMTDKIKPSTFRIIQSDYLALLGVLVPIVSLIMYIAVAYFGYFPGLRGRDPIQGTEGAPLFLNLFIAGLVIGVPLAIWRIRSIQRLFSKSVEVVGQITDVSFHRDRGRVEYSYTYQGQAYSGGNAIMKTGKTQKLRSGNEVVLLVNPDDPRRALIRDLYI
jgi:hypothetical protein